MSRRLKDESRKKSKTTKIKTPTTMLTLLLFRSKRRVTEKMRRMVLALKLARSKISRIPKVFTMISIGNKYLRNLVSKTTRLKKRECKSFTRSIKLKER